MSCIEVRVCHNVIKTEISDNEEEIHEKARKQQRVVADARNSSVKGRPFIYYFEGDGNAIKEAKAILSSVLPEFTLVDWSNIIGIDGCKRDDRREWEKLKDKPSNPYDVFLMTINVKPSLSLLAAWIAKLYKRKVVYISGGSTSSPVLHDNTYLLGPSRRDERDFHVYQLYYFQMVYWQKFHAQSSGDLLWNHKLKPRNNGKHFRIYAQGNCVSFREEAFDELSRIGPVHQGGKCKGLKKSTNKTIVKTQVSLRNGWDDVNVYREYRFCLVMEHGNVDGYITEKILMAFAGGCLPIYYGTTQVWNVFNKKAFIYYDIENPFPAQSRGLPGEEPICLCHHDGPADSCQWEQDY